VVALEPRPIKPKIAFDTIDGFNEAKGAAPIPIVALVKATTHFYGITNPTFFHTIAKYESKSGGKYWYGKKDFNFGTTRTYCDLATTTKNSYYNYRSKSRCYVKGTRGCKHGRVV